MIAVTAEGSQVLAGSGKQFSLAGGHRQVLKFQRRRRTLFPRSASMLSMRP